MAGDWLMVNPGSGSGMGSLDITAAANVDVTGRSAKVVVTDINGGRAEVGVTQAAPVPGNRLVATPAVLFVSRFGADNFEFYIDSSSEWEVTSAPGWVGWTKGSDISLRVTIDSPGVSRDGVVVLENSTDRLEIPVTQDCAPLYETCVLGSSGVPALNNPLVTAESVPFFINEGGLKYWQYESPSSGNAGGLELVAIQGEAPWLWVTMQVNLSHWVSPGGLLSVPVGPGRRVRVVADYVDHVLVTLWQDEEQVLSIPVALVPGQINEIRIQPASAYLAIVINGVELYRELLTGPWRVGNSAESTGIYAGMDPSSLMPAYIYAAYGVRVYQLDVI